MSDNTRPNSTDVQFDYLSIPPQPVTGGTNDGYWDRHSGVYCARQV